MSKLKDYKELTAHGAPDALRQFVAALEAAPARGWRRDRGAETQLTRSAPDGEWVCFACDEAPGRHAALLWLVPRSAEEWYVSNIVPVSVPRFGYDAYNTVLSDFVDFASGAAQTAGVRLGESGGSLDLGELLTSNTIEALRRFSRLANRSTGSAHPSDQDRWFAFVTAAHKDGARLGSNDLLRWLVESEGWESDQAHELVIEYEQQRALLRYYDRDR